MFLMNLRCTCSLRVGGRKKEQVKNRAVMTNTKEIYLIKYARELPFEQAADSGISHGKRRLSLSINSH